MCLEEMKEATRDAESAQRTLIVNSRFIYVCNYHICYNASTAIYISLAR